MSLTLLLRRGGSSGGRSLVERAGLSPEGIVAGVRLGLARVIDDAAARDLVREPADVAAWFCTLAVALTYGEDGIASDAAQADVTALSAQWETRS